MARFLYTLLYLLLIPFILLRMWLRGAKNPGYRQRWAERFAIFSKPEIKAEKIIWLHAVSVGESIAALPLIKELLVDPTRHLVITNTTPTGLEQVRKMLTQEIEQGRISQLFLPYDLPWSMNRLIKKIKPELCIIMETELWPNMLAACEQQQVRTLLANARLSEKSAKGYGKLSSLTVPMFKRLNHIAAQNQADADRFISLGYPQQQVTVTGSIKFDVSADPQAVNQGQQLKAQLGADRLVLTLASSHQGEDEILLTAFKQLKQQLPKLMLMIIPRHPERFDDVAKLAQQYDFKLQRQTEINTAENLASDIDVLLADTMGQMIKLLAASDLVVMGGSFIEHGGHNPLEACAVNKPVMIGNHYFNFAAIIDELNAASAIRVTDQDKLVADLAELISDQKLRTELADNGQQILIKNQGVVPKLMALITEK